MFGAKLHRVAYVVRIQRLEIFTWDGMKTTRGDLIVFLGLQVKVCFDTSLCWIKGIPIISIALYHGFRYHLEKLFGMMPHVIRPDLKSNVFFHHFRDIKIEITPPELVFPDNDVIKMTLMIIVFLIHPEMDEPGVIENLIGSS